MDGETGAMFELEYREGGHYEFVLDLLNIYRNICWAHRKRVGSLHDGFITLEHVNISSGLLLVGFGCGIFKMVIGVSADWLSALNFCEADCRKP